MLARRSALLGLLALTAILTTTSCSAHATAHAKPAWIEAYSGWASPTGGKLYARVHEGASRPAPKADQSTAKRLKQTWEAFDLDALEGATVSIAGLPGTPPVPWVADDHGFVTYPIPGGLAPGVLTLTLTLTSAGYSAAPAQLEIQVFDDAPGLAILADIDDTLIDTGVTDKSKLLESTFLRSSWEMKSFPGLPGALTALSGRDPNGRPTIPLFYLSGSPWTFHTRIADFFDRSGFPRGARILRRYSQEPLDAFEFKLPHLQEIVGAFHHKRWILLGDSGEKDPEVYACLRHTFPGNWAGEYIHLVTKEEPGLDRFSGAQAFRDWSTLDGSAIVRAASAEPGAAGDTPPAFWDQVPKDLKKCPEVPYH